MAAKKNQAKNKTFKRFLNSIWLFPVLAAFALILLTSFKISGSSIGTYYTYFYGNTSRDPNLLLNRPRLIRSDEWLTGTQMSIAQKNANFQKTNPNIGNGENMSIILDVPTKDWSTFFKPQNWAFFVLPFDYAFAFKWWLMGYLLAISTYFFILFLLPNRRLLAAILSAGVFFSPFIQWWYQYITLGSIYYSLFLALGFVYLLRTKSRWKGALIAALMAYLLVCFALLQYPPFQIACGLAILAFAVGYSIENIPNLTNKEVLQKAGLLVVSGVIAAAVVLGFLANNHAAYKATTDTVYPGHRNVMSGGFDENRLLTSDLAFQFQFTRKAVNYYFPVRGIANQSEASNFIYLMPFLIVPELMLLIYCYKRKSFDWPIAATIVLFCLFMIRMLTPYFNGPFKLLLLNQVLMNRLIIGLGLLGIINLILLVRCLKSQVKFEFSQLFSILYSLAVFIIEVAAGTHIKNMSPGFITTAQIIILSAPIPIIIYLVLRRHFLPAAVLLLVFSMASTIGVNPIYRGTDVLSKTPLSSAIQKTAESNKGYWVGEGIMLENFASLNGANSLSGIYSYPQLDLWSKLDPAGKQSDIYNRYAHVDFKIDNQNPFLEQPTLTLRGGDNFLVTTGACSSFLQKENVHFLLTEEALPAQATCASLVDKIPYPSQSIFIYRVN